MFEKGQKKQRHSRKTVPLFYKFHFVLFWVNLISLYIKYILVIIYA
jgi:hypothetical protein